MLTTLLVKGSVHAKIERDLQGLGYEFNRKGLMLHPEFGGWVTETVEIAARPN